MDFTAILFVFGFLLLFGWMIYMSVQSSRKEKETKKQAIQSLGFSSFDADESLAEKISNLYQRPWSKNNYQLRNVSRRLIPGGEIFLFDLVDTSGEDDSWMERQAVAIISSSLNLPPFAFFFQNPIKNTPSAVWPTGLWNGACPKSANRRHFPNTQRWLSVM